MASCLGGEVRRVRQLDNSASCLSGLLFQPSPPSARSALRAPAPPFPPRWSPVSQTPSPAAPPPTVSLPPFVSSTTTPTPPSLPIHSPPVPNSPSSSPVVAHEPIGVRSPTGLPARLSQGLEKAIAIAIISKDRLAPIAAADHMVDRPGELDPGLARHRLREVNSDGLQIDGVHRLTPQDLVW